MIRSRITRLTFSAAVALALPIGGAIVFSASPASAAVKTITCTKAKGNADTTMKIQLKGCNGNTGGKSKKLSITLLASGGTVPWTNGKTTTFGSPTLGSGTDCSPTAGAGGDETFTGQVTADTTKSAKPIPGNYSGEVCIDANGNFSFPPGSPLTIN